MNSRFIPSLLIPEVYFSVKEKKNLTADLIESFGDQGFYRSFEIGDGFDRKERKRILNVKEKRNLKITQWLTFLIDKNGLNVSSLDSQHRRYSAKQMKDSMYLAAECGASSIAFVTGQDPGDARREEAMKGLYESLCDICEKALTYQMNVMVEPLDRYAHKKRLIGPTTDATQLITEVREDYENIGIAFDTAHAALNNENMMDAVELANKEIKQIHFSNAVLDAKSELYGDNHMPIGEPGFMTPERVGSILRKVDELGIQSEEGLPIAIEVRGKNEKDCHLNEQMNRTILENALSIVGGK